MSDKNSYSSVRQVQTTTRLLTKKQVARLVVLGEALRSLLLVVEDGSVDAMLQQEDDDGLVATVGGAMQGCVSVAVAAVEVWRRRAVNNAGHRRNIAIASSGEELRFRVEALCVLGGCKSWGRGRRCD